MRRFRCWTTILALLLGGAGPVLAQQQKSSRPASTAGNESAEPVLRYEREFFVYPQRAGRDPFTPLAALRGAGPRFEDLALQGVIHAADGRSVALLSDGGGRIYRVRRGDVVGNARVISISLMKVVFAVENFGIVRQEELVLKRKDEEGGQP